MIEKRDGPIRCVSCGKFIANAELAKAKFIFEPDNHFGPEVTDWVCEKCVREQRV